MTDPQQSPAASATEQVARKTCPRCKVPLLLSAFAKNATNIDGLQGTCRECMRVHKDNYRKANGSRPKNKLVPRASAPAGDAEQEIQSREGASSPGQHDREDVSGKTIEHAQAQERERESGQAEKVEMAMLDVRQIVASTTNPRRHFDPKFIEDLAESIRTQGLAQPILVRPLPGARLAETYTDRRADAPRPTHEIIAGEQRFRALQLAGLRQVPALIRHLDDAAVLQLQLVENLRRRDLHPMEEAEGYARLQEQLGMPVEVIAKSIGKSIYYVYNTLRLLDLEPEAREAFYDGQMDRSVAELVAKRPANLQIQLLKEVTAKDYGGERMSWRQARTLVETKYMLKLAEAPFSTTDPTLVPEAGACGPCPKRTGSNPQLFQEVANRDTCTDTACFALKREAHYGRIRTEAEALGTPVLVGKEAKEIMPTPGKLIGYTRVDEIQNLGGKPRTLREALGDAMPTPTLVEDPTTHAMVAILPTTVVGQLLKAQGLARAEAKTSAEDLARESLLQYERDWRTRAVELLHAETERRIVGLGPEVLRLIAGMLLDSCQGLHRQLICKALGIGKVGDLQGIQEAIADCEPGRLESLLLLVLMTQDVPTSIGSDGTAKPAPRIQAIAADLGVDLEPVRAAVRESMREALQPAPAAPTSSSKPGRKARPSADQVQAEIAEQLQALDQAEPEASP